MGIGPESSVNKSSNVVNSGLNNSSPENTTLGNTTH